MGKSLTSKNDDLVFENVRKQCITQTEISIEL